MWLTDVVYLVGPQCYLNIGNHIPLWMVPSVQAVCPFLWALPSRITVADTLPEYLPWDMFTSALCKSLYMINWITVCCYLHCGICILVPCNNNISHLIQRLTIGNAQSARQKEMYTIIVKSPLCLAKETTHSAKPMEKILFDKGTGTNLANFSSKTSCCSLFWFPSYVNKINQSINQSIKGKDTFW